MKYRKTIVAGSLVFVCVLCLIIYFVSQQKQEPDEPQPNQVQSETFHEGSIVEYLNTETIDFDDYNIDVHRIEENRIYVSLQEKVDSHFTGLLTRQLGYIDVNTMEYHTSKVFDDDIRVWDYIYIGDTLVYSRVGEVTDVVMEKDGKSTIVDSLESAWGYPILTRFNDLVYYAKHYVDDEDSQKLVTFALKSFDLENVETIYEHSCYANLGGESTFDENCLTGLGQIYASDETVYYYESSASTSVMHIYNPESKLFETVDFGEYVAPTLAYFDSLGKAVAGFNVDTLTNVADIYLYDIESGEKAQRILRNVKFGRPITFENFVVFVDAKSVPDQTIFVDINTNQYQIIKKTNDSEVFAKYYVYQNKVYAVWADTITIIEVYEILTE